MLFQIGGRSYQALDLREAVCLAIGEAQQLASRGLSREARALHISATMALAGKAVPPPTSERPSPASSSRQQRFDAWISTPSATTAGKAGKPATL